MTQRFATWMAALAALFLLACASGGPRAPAPEPKSDTPKADASAMAVPVRAVFADAGAPDAPASAVDAAPEAARAQPGPPPAYAAQLRAYPRDFASADPGDGEMAFDADGFDPPAQGARFAVADRDGLVGVATVRRVFTVARSCSACGAPSRYFVARFDGSPRASHGAVVAVGPAALLPDASRLRTWDHAKAVEGLTGIVASVDLDGDGAADLAMSSADHACAGAARIRPRGSSPCDYMNDVCEEKWAREAAGWRAMERVSSGYCVMDGHRGLTF